MLCPKISNRCPKLSISEQIAGQRRMSNPVRLLKVRRATWYCIAGIPCCMCLATRAEQQAQILCDVEVHWQPAINTYQRHHVIQHYTTSNHMSGVRRNDLVHIVLRITAVLVDGRHSSLDRN
ncbi:hypothetical protein TNCV_2725071 [Trichonephila clavipes]|nr:hypothetical protein TNCV_2725071 [Trichonephila clavipes]